MIDLHAPLEEKSAPALRDLIVYVTDGLDAVVISHNPSRVYQDFVLLVLAGNPRDLATAVERAAKIGGKVD